MAEAGTPPRPIGGFFGLALNDVPPPADSVWASWTRQGALALTAWTARAALARLIAAKEPPRVWLPAYVCRDIVSVAPSSTVRLYPLDRERPSPDVQFLREHVRPGEMVVAIDYFGWPPSRDFIAFVAGRPEVIWVEDRAQCLWTDHPAWAPWLLYSPRKLLGVPDGGMLISTRGQAAPLKVCGHSDVSWVTPELMRFEDAEETDNAAWYRAFKLREAHSSAEALPMSRLSKALLQRIPLGPLVQARQRNYAYLARELGVYAAWQRDVPRTAPFGFVIAVDDAEAVAAALASERIFCARHWAPADLPSDRADFAWEHQLARRSLTLPCDHRYDAEMLVRLVEAVRRIVPQPQANPTALESPPAAREKASV